MTTPSDLALRQWLENNIAVNLDGGDEAGSRAELVSRSVAAAYQTLLMRLDEGFFRGDPHRYLDLADPETVEVLAAALHAEVMGCKFTEADEYYACADPGYHRAQATALLRELTGGGRAS